MSSGQCVSSEKSREWRRKVLVTARIRSAEGWADARILNVSSRGLMIWTAQPPALGRMIEFRRGDQVFFARVVWECGSRAGLRSGSILPVTDLMCVSEKLGDTPPLWASAAASADRRLEPRRDRAIHRHRASVMQYAAIAIVAALAAFGLGSAALAALGLPLEQVQQAIRG